MLNTHTVKEYAFSLGFDHVRVTTGEAFPDAERVIKARIEQGLMDGLPWFTAERAAVSCHPDALLPDAQSIISLALCYLTESPTEPTGQPSDEDTEHGPRGRISRYAWGEDYHDIIKPKLHKFAAWLREYTRAELGTEAETRLFVDTGRIVDRAVAQRAGLGWYGKNTNILTKGWGSWVFLAEIVTNLSLVPDEPLKANCGSCERCLHACPTGALPNPYELDMTRCISFLTIELRGSIPLELRPLMGNLIFGCDICQDVCPVNLVAERRLGLRESGQRDDDKVQRPFRTTQSMIQVQPRRHTARATSLFQGHEPFRPRPQVGGAPELIPLLSLTEEEFAERFRHSPIKRTKRRGFLRNVCVALGNSKDRRAIPALIQAMSDEEPLVRGHAAWALGQLGDEQAQDALTNARSIETDDEVLREIACALAT